MKRILSNIILLLVCTLLRANPVCRVNSYGDGGGDILWHVTQLLQDRKGMIWMATWNGLSRFDGTTFHTFKSQAGDGSVIPTDRIRDIWLLPNGNIGCRIDEQLFEFDVRQCRFRAFHGKAELGRQSVFMGNKETFCHTDRYGAQWRLTRNGQLSVKDKHSSTFVPYDINVTTGSLRQCMTDRQGNLWAVSQNALYRFTFAESPIEPMAVGGKAQVKALFVDSKHRYWITTRDDATVRLFDGNNRLLGYLSPDGTLSSRYVSFRSPIYCVMQMRDGTFFLGSKPDGLFRLTEQGDGRFTIKKIEGLSCPDVYDIKEDSHGRLWVATLGGGVNCVATPHADRPTVVTPGNGLTGYPKTQCLRVRSLHITEGGTMLIATTEGLVVTTIEPNKSFGQMVFRVHQREARRKTSLSCSAIMNIAEDGEGRIYIATESGGVNKITSKRLTDRSLDFSCFNVQRSMPTDVTLSATVVGGRLMVVCANQIVFIRLDNGAIESFDKRFFLSDVLFSDACPVALPDGRWLFALQDGCFAVSPTAMRKSGFVPPVVFTSVSIDNAMPSTALGYTDTLTLQANERNVTIGFAALDYADNEAISYAFRLLPQGQTDETWNNIGRNRSVTLLDLSPGTYRLQVRSTNADGVWTRNTATVTIIVVPRWYETTAARILFLLLTLAVVATVVYTLLYIRRIKRQRRETLAAYLELLNKTDAPANHPQTASPQVDADDDAMMKRVTAFVEQHIADADINVGDMASAAATSRSGLQRKMKQLLGITPLDFLREARIKHACQLLRTTDKTVSEVAFSSGFSDPKYFSRCFKASVGQTPTDYKTAGN